MIMNSRERIIGAVNHRQTDRIPVDLGGTVMSGISAIAYNKLAKHLGTGGHAGITDIIQQTSAVDMEIVNILGVDVIDINSIIYEQGDRYEAELADGSKAGFPSWFRPGKMPDGSWQAVDEEGNVISRMAAGGNVFNQVFFPYRDGYPEDLRDFRKVMKSLPGVAYTPLSKVSATGMSERVTAMKKAADKAITMPGVTGLLETGNSARTMENFLADLLLNQGKVSEILDLAMDMNMETLARLCSSPGDVADVICFGDDLGMQTGPLMHLDVFRKFFRPRYMIICDYVKSHSDMKVLFHSCGSIRQFIPDLIDVGFDILNPVQTGCRDMDPVVLKKEFGRDITFWGGGVDTSGVLVKGTPGDVRDDVMRRCEILSKDGGFVFAPEHNILPEVPPVNIIAAYRAVHEFNGIIK